MVFWQCFYHVIWATKNRDPLLEEKYEKVVFEAVSRKSASIGCEVLAINGMPDHVHVAVRMPPTMAIADWVKSVKGVSSRELNTVLPESHARFRWQQGYGVLTFGAKNLDFVVGYIRNQKGHHTDDDLYTYLERVDN